MVSLDIFRDESPRAPTDRELEKLNKSIDPKDYGRLHTKFNTPVVSTPRFDLVPFFPGQYPWAKLRAPDGIVVQGYQEHVLHLVGRGDYWNAAELLERAGVEGSGVVYEVQPFKPVVYMARVEFGPGISGAVFSFDAFEPTADSGAVKKVRVDVPPLSELAKRKDATMLKWPPFQPGNGSFKHSTAEEVVEMAKRGRNGFKLGDGWPILD